MAPKISSEQTPDFKNSNYLSNIYVYALLLYFFYLCIFQPH